MDNQELRGKIRGALARGYCYSVNKNKVLDPDLIESMTEEVERLFLAVIENLPPTPSCLGDAEIEAIIVEDCERRCWHTTLNTKGEEHFYSLNNGFNLTILAKALSGRVFKPQEKK